LKFILYIDCGIARQTASSMVISLASQTLYIDWIYFDILCNNFVIEKLLLAVYILLQD